ncbi:hypothetical protein N9R52_01595 [Porticoccaceae bacterium]|nr:hypothetical protein [Porticoccaceae bacterium]
MAGEYKRLINGTAVNGLGLVVLALSGFFVIPIQIYYLGLENFGLVVLGSMFSIQGLISVLDLGIPGAVTRQVASLRKDSEICEIGVLYSSSIIIFLSIGLVLGSTLYLGSSLIASYFVKDASDTAAMLALGLQAVFISYIWQFPLLILKAQMQGFALFERLQLASVSVEALRVIAIVTVLKFGYGFQYVIFCSALFPALEFLVLSCLCPTSFRVPSFINGKQSLSKIALLSKQLFLGRLSGSFFNNSDKVVASIFFGPIGLGVIEVFTKMPALLNRVFGLSVSAIIPVVGGLSWPDDKDKIANIYHVGFKTYFIVICFPILQLIYFTPEVLNLWIGQEDRDLITCMQLMLLWTLLVPLAFGGNILIALNRGVQKLTKIRIVLAVLKVLSLIVLVTGVGIYAIPLSYLISCVAYISLLALFKNMINISLRRQMLDYFRIIIGASGPILGYHLFFGVLDPTRLAGLLVSIVLITGSQILVIYFLALSEKERIVVKHFISSRLVRFSQTGP